MRKLRCLLRVQMSAMVHAMNVSSKRSGALGGAALLFIADLLMAFFFAIYAAGIGLVLQAHGALDLLMPLMGLLVAASCLLLTAMGAQHVVFGTRDADLLLSLPVGSFSVMLSKTLALYLENLSLFASGMVPSGIVWMVLAGRAGVWAVLALAAGCVCAAALPTLAGVVAGFLMAWLSGRVRHKALASGALSVVFTLAILVGSMQINRLAAWVLTNADGLRHVFATWLLPFGLWQRAMAGGAAALAALALVCLAPFFLAVWLMSTQYKRILSALRARLVRGDYRLARVAASGQFAALFAKEAGRFFGCSVFLVNMGLGAVMLAAAGVAALAFSGPVRIACAQLGAAASVEIALGAMAFMLALSNTACVSISLEGRSMWIVKSAPVSARAFFGAKLALQLAVCWPCIAVTGVCAALSGALGAGTVALLAASGACYTLFTAVWGLWANLFFPRLDCDNETIVVKQSAASFAGLFGGMVLALPFAGVYFLVARAAGAGAPAGMAAVCAALLAAAWVLWRLLLGAGARRLAKIA